MKHGDFWKFTAVPSAAASVGRIQVGFYLKLVDLKKKFLLLESKRIIVPVLSDPSEYKASTR